MRLSDSSNSTPIPYRDSKLTRILRSALEGNSKVVLICNITASSFVYEETLSTIKFALKAKGIRQNAKKNEIIGDQMILKKYENEIKILQSKLKQMESVVNEKKNEKNIEIEISKVRDELSTVVSEKNKLGTILDDTIQEKVMIENELERLKAKILVSERISFNSIEIGLVDVKSHERRRNRISMIRDPVKGRFQSEVLDIKTIQAIRNMEFDPVQLLVPPKKIKNREDLIIEKIEENMKQFYNGRDL